MLMKEKKIKIYNKKQNLIQKKGRNEQPKEYRGYAHELSTNHILNKRMKRIRYKSLFRVTGNRRQLIEIKISSNQRYGSRRS